MSEDLRVALVTGATGGIGKEVSIGLAYDGYMLSLAARSKSRLETLADEINTVRGKSDPLVSIGDITVPEYAEQVVEETMKRFGRIDLLFNAIGIHKMGNWEITSAVFEEQMSANVSGVFNMVKAAVPRMIKQGSGHIITVASRRGKIASAEEGAYSASKYAVVGMNEALYKELAPRGIKATVICPGWVDTPMVKGVAFPKHEMISAYDILETVRFLTKLSPAACIKEVLIEPRSDIS
jgi:NAD(P)-dependent dehydrogenase (short-subunit alcohol dehydrogenase family)